MLPYLLLTGESSRTVERQVSSARGRLLATSSRPVPCVGDIFAPHRKACQCLFPILPQCDTFLIIVFPMYFIALLRRA
jgi:hypothetical protein